MRSRNFLLLIVVGVSFCLGGGQLFAQAPWRTHYVKRDGLFHVEKYRTGNGITNNGLVFLQTVTQAAAPIVAGLTRDLDAKSGQRELDNSWEESYNSEQSRAQEIYDRLIELRDRWDETSASAPASNTSAASDPSAVESKRLPVADPRGKSRRRP